MTLGSGLELVRLGLQHVEEIGAFLDLAWRRQFTTGTFPVFSPQYLGWLYDGPHAGETVLLGVRSAGRLVGFRALLFQPLIVRGQYLRAHVGTHLAVHPDLPLSDRIAAVDALGQLYSFVNGLGGEPLLERGPMDALISYFDEAKQQQRFQRAADYRLSRAGIVRTKVSFQQAIVNPRHVERTLDSPDAHGHSISEAARDDAASIAALIAASGREHAVAVAATEQWVRHSVFGFADSRAFMCIDDGAPTGVLSCYAVDTISNQRIRRVVVIDYLVVTGAPAVAAALVGKALEFAKSQRATGLVMENPTCLSEDVYRAAGLMPSMRRTMAAFAIRGAEVGEVPSFLLTIK